jgi:hypothetical protein
MGYYTRFELSISGQGPIYERLRDGADGLTFGEYDIKISRLINGDCDTMKWYGYNDDMLELSRDWPNVLFELTGEGEESGDLWRAFYRNGKFVKVEGVVAYDIPDLDKVLPLDVGLQERLKAQHKKELQENIQKLKEQLEALDREHKSL